MYKSIGGMERERGRERGGEREGERERGRERGERESGGGEREK